MGRIESTNLAHCRSLLQENSATTCRDGYFNDRFPDRSVTLVRWANPPGLPATSKALAGAGATQQRFARGVRLGRAGIDLGVSGMLRFWNDRGPQAFVVANKVCNSYQKFVLMWETPGETVQKSVLSWRQCNVKAYLYSVLGRVLFHRLDGSVKLGFTASFY
jgi:hypothetical protein